jgi:hypothetical protein
MCGMKWGAFWKLLGWSIRIEKNLKKPPHQIFPIEKVTRVQTNIFSSKFNDFEKLGAYF